MVAILTLWAILSAILIFRIQGKLMQQQKELEAFKTEASDAYRRLRGWIADVNDKARPHAPVYPPAPVPLMHRRSLAETIAENS
jgi:hypothetical protein